LDDPGLLLRIQQPHILRSLSVMNVCDLPLGKSHDHVISQAAWHYIPEIIILLPTAMRTLDFNVIFVLRLSFIQGLAGAQIAYLV
jgi:hypothetical protein